MKMTAFQFDSPNNSCASLRMLAELVRRGDTMVLAAQVDVGGTLRISLAEPTRRERRQRSVSQET